MMSAISLKSNKKHIYPFQIAAHTWFWINFAPSIARLNARNNIKPENTIKCRILIYRYYVPHGNMHAMNKKNTCLYTRYSFSPM